MNELIYRPQHKPEQELINDFVIRLTEYQKIINNIKSEDLATIPQHLILQGMRGMGKTTLMHRVFYELNESYRDKGLVPVIFSEEQYSVRTLYKLWEEAARYLEDHEEKYSGIWYEMQDAQEHDDYEEECFDTLKAHIKSNGHRLVLFIDNFGIMVDKFGRHEQQRLREILIDFKGIKIIGGSSVLLESFYKYDKPFFDFFKVIKLEKLDKKEVETLLRRLEDKRGTNKINEIITKQPGRIESLRILTGGVPRTIVLLFEIFLDDRNGNSIDDLKKLLDDVTPLYKHRMDELPPQQQEIVDKLALNWDGMSVAELTKKTRMESKAISAQLSNLVKSNVVTANKSTGKNKFYQLEERFFNIWYLMHHAPRSARKKVIWLTRFLEMWCNNSMLSQSATDFISRMKKGGLNPEYITTMTHAYASVDGLDFAMRDEMIEVAGSKIDVGSEVNEPLPIKYSNVNAEFNRLLSQKDFNAALSIIDKSGMSDGASFFYKARVQHVKEKIDEAIELLKGSVEKGFVPSITYLGAIYHLEFHDFKRAIKFYSIAVEKSDVDSMFNLGKLYSDLNNADMAIQYYSMASEKGHVGAMNNLGYLYIKLKNTNKAIECFLLAIDNGHNHAMFNLGKLYHEHKKINKAIKYYSMASEKGHLSAMNNLGNIYEELRNTDQARENYIKAIEKGHVGALTNLGNHYLKLEDYDEAIKYYLLAVERGQADAMFNMGNLYQRLKNIDKAKEYYLMAVEKDHADAMFNLGLLYLKLERYKESDELLKRLITNDENVQEYLMPYLGNVIARGMTEYAYKVFNHEEYQLKDKLKVLYYALMTIMEDEYPNEIKKMGKELEEPVMEMVKQIEELKKELQSETKSKS